MGQKELGRCCGVSGPSGTPSTQENILEGRTPNLDTQKLERDFQKKATEISRDVERGREGAG